MDTCYRGMPKFIGAFIDAIYENPTMLLLSIVSVSALAGFWWYKANQKTEKIFTKAVSIHRDRDSAVCQLILSRDNFYNRSNHD